MARNGKTTYLPRTSRNKVLQHLTERDGRPEYSIIEEALVMYAKAYPKAREALKSKAGRPKKESKEE